MAYTDSIVVLEWKETLGLSYAAVPRAGAQVDGTIWHLCPGGLDIVEFGAMHGTTGGVTITLLVMTAVWFEIVATYAVPPYTGGFKRAGIQINRRVDTGLVVTVGANPQNASVMPYVLGRRVGF